MRQTFLAQPESTSRHRAAASLSADLAEYKPLEAAFESRLDFRPAWRSLTTFQPNRSLPIHNWFYCPQAFSAPLVDQLCALLRLQNSATILDPFSGVGTTAVEGRLQGYNCIAVDAFPLFCFITKVKSRFVYPGVDLNSEVDRLFDGSKNEAPAPKPPHPLFDRAFSPVVLDEILRLKSWISKEENAAVRELLLLGLLSIVNDVGFTRRAGAHYRFIDVDNIGVRHQFSKLPAKPAQVDQVMRSKLDRIVRDIALVRSTQRLRSSEVDSFQPRVILGDARNLTAIDDASVDAVITSPPYLNRDSYVAQYKLELFLADPPYGAESFEDYRRLTRASLASHVEADHARSTPSSAEVVPAITEELRSRELNNPGIPDMVTGYFADMGRVSEELFRVLKEGGKGALVVGNVRFAGLHIPVDLVLASLLEDRGFDIERIVVSRFKGNSPQQMKRFGAFPVRESTVVFSK